MRRAGIGRPTTRAFPSASHGIGEKEPLHERRREPVREAEVRVRLGQRGRNAAEPRGEHHRPADVAAAPEYDVGPPASRMRRHETRRRGGERKRAHELRPGTAREARDAEGVERVSALRNEPRLDAIRRPGERHFHPARAQRFRHRERRRDVTHRPPGRDQAPQLSLLCHDHRRC